MNKFIPFFLVIMLVLGWPGDAVAKGKGIKEYHAYVHQHLDPDPRNAGNWLIGAPEELKTPYVILLSKNYIRVGDVSYFIDKAVFETKDYTPEENAGYAKSTSFAATSLTGESIFVTIEYANRENPDIYGFSIFDRANQGHFYLALWQH